MSNPETNKEHVRHCMLLFFDQGLNATKATEAITEIYGQVLTVRRCQFWFKRFKSGNRDCRDAPKSGRPSNFDDNVLKSLVESDPRLTIEELSQKLACPWSTVQLHLKRIGKSNRMGIWTPHELSQDNKDERRNTCISLLSRQIIRPFLHQIVTGDEKWIVYDNVSRKRQWLSQNQTPIPSAKPGMTLRKLLLCIWWDVRGIIHYELLKPGETITAEMYCQQLERLNQKLKSKRPSLFNRKGIILQHDNARPHKARKTSEKIRELNWEVLPHPPYSPDLAPSDYHLFRSMEHSLREKKFRSAAEVENHLKEYFDSKSESFFKRGIEKLQERWEAVANNEGNYIL